MLKFRKKNKSWGETKIHVQLEALDHGLDMLVNRSVVCRIISESISEKNIKSYYSDTFAKHRANLVKTPAPHHGIILPNNLLSYAIGGVQMNTMYVRTIVGSYTIDNLLTARFKELIVLFF